MKPKRLSSNSKCQYMANDSLYTQFFPCRSRSVGCNSFSFPYLNQNGQTKDYALLILSHPRSSINIYPHSPGTLLSIRCPYIIPPCGSPSPPPLCSGSNCISVSILMMAMQASTALLSCRTLLMLGSSTPTLTISLTLPSVRSSP